MKQARYLEVKTVLDDEYGDVFLRDLIDILTEVLDRRPQAKVTVQGSRYRAAALTILDLEPPRMVEARLAAETETRDRRIAQLKAELAELEAQ